MLWRPYFETLGVLILAVLGALLGLRAAKMRPPVWLLAYLVPLAMLASIAIARRIPEVEFAAPFCWIMADRREFASLAFLSTLMLTALLPRLLRKGQKVMVALFMVVFVTVYSILPFLLPGLNYAYHLNLKTRIDAAGICLQSNNYDCGPAAAVTTLRRLGLPAEEGELAILAHTTSIAGTPADSLCVAINRRYEHDGIHAVYRRFNSVADLRGKEPVIAVMKFGFLVDHYVAVLRVSETEVQVGDPLEGLRTMSQRQFAQEWRKCGIVLQRTASE